MIFNLSSSFSGIKPPRFLNKKHISTHHLKDLTMDPLLFLFVSINSESHQLLTQSLENLGLPYRIKDVNSKMQALQACYKGKFDVLITKEVLPDGNSSDLTRVLSGLMPCLVVQDKTEQQSREVSYLSIQEYAAWDQQLMRAIRNWENNLTHQVHALQESQRTLYDKATAECAQLLYHSSENKIEDTLKIVMEVLQVSKTYIRKGNSKGRSLTCLVLSEGIRLSDSDESIQEIAIQRADGRTDYLGVAECLYPRSWKQVEIDFLRSIASLFEESRKKILRKINMYAELSLSA